MNAKSLALVSGKGGSGKTTIGICMAKMLADCGERVLLIDCDLSTCGATYFFEDYINNVGQRVVSFVDLLGYILDQYSIGCLETIEDLKVNNPRFLNINETLCFVPSILPRDVSVTHFDNISIKKHENKFFKLYNDYIKTQFDIVIYDCQAGFSNVLDFVLPTCDSVLLVMEADAISSAAARNLYIRIAPLVSKTRMYQIFSKVTEEEKKIYGQVMLGTFYTTIDAILFDLNVRKAFAVAEFPDLMNIKSEFGMQIYNICTKVFPLSDIQNILNKYNLIFKFNKLSGAVVESRPKAALLGWLCFSGFFVMFSFLLAIITKMEPSVIAFDQEIIEMLMLFSVCIMAGTISYMVGNGEFKKWVDYRKYRMQLNELINLNPEIEKIIQ